jgi:raffinose/stachyose/melibiose transport system permease protein
MGLGSRAVDPGARISERIQPSASRRSSIYRIARHWRIYLLAVPSYLLVVVFVYWPAALALYYSFFQWDGVRASWIGLANYANFTRDAPLYNSVWNITQLTVADLLTRLTIPLFVAVLIFRLRSQRAAYWYRTLLVVPMVVPSIVTFLVWRWFYSYEGAINIVLRAIGHPEAARAWLGEPSLALIALMFVGFPWAGGLAMLIYLAGLQQIPSETIEASIVDGVGTFSRFFYIELPLVIGQLKLLLALILIGALQQFTLPLVMTYGGPGWATMVPGLRLFYATQAEFQYGYASAIGVALFVAILALTLLSQRYLRSSVEYAPDRSAR